MTVATKPSKSTQSVGTMERLIDRAERDSLRRDFEMLRERSSTLTEFLKGTSGRSVGM